MNSYELTVLISSKFNETKLKEASAKINQLIKTVSGKMKKEDFWGKKTLAYPISKEKEAQFVNYLFECQNLSKDFAKKIKLVPGVLRFLLLKK